MPTTDLISAKALYPERAENEIDLLALLELLLQSKKWIAAITLACAVMGLVLSFLLPQKWTSQAIISTPEQAQLTHLHDAISRLQALDVEVKGTREDVYNYFIKEFTSRSQFQDWLLNTPPILKELTAENLDADQMHKAIVRLAESLKAQNNSDPKKPEDQPFSSWTLSFTGKDPEQAQWLLNEYMQFTADKVRKDVIKALESQVHARLDYEKEKQALERVTLENERIAKIQRLKYALSIANAAGIQKPVYSEGSAVHDDPDYAVTLGADGIAAKLQVEKSLTDVSTINPTLLNREYRITQLNNIKLPSTDFMPFKYLLSPSLPVKHDGPGKSLIILLSALLGFMLACGGVLMRKALSARA